MDFTINGERVSLSDNDVRRAVRDLEPGVIHSHSVSVGGVDFPVKQVFAAASGMDLLDFTTNQARRVLKRLGFELTRVA
ncbi:MAG TPA: hypothetical protein DCP20_00820 [Coriobacteriia bacterium]|nr:MAG: hypothetical protein XD74_1015 [Actinobacteria bacterium 66_15]HAL29244.1 hypothetical protein [Coriobacteriia bacterium]